MLTCISLRKAKPLTLLVLVLIGVFIPVSVNARVVYSCNLKLLAIDESRRGIVVEFELKVEKPGSGDIQYDKIEKDTLTSFKLALIYASIITGVDYKCCNYKLSVATGVKGLSATLAFYMFLVDLFEHNTCPRGYTATGIIGPGGIVGVVSGFEEKLRVAGEERLRIYAQAFQVKNATTSYVSVAQVYSIYDAYKALGGQLRGDLDVLEKYAKIYQQVFLGPYKSLLETTEVVISRIENVNWRDSYFTRTLQLLELAKSAANRGKYYVASSIAFRALVQAYSSWINYTLQVANGNIVDGIEEAVRNALEEANRVILEVGNELRAQAEHGYIDLGKLDMLSAAYMRAHETTTLLQTTEWGTGEISKYAMALARSNSAVAWFNISKLPDMVGKPVNTDILETALTYIRDYWSTLRDYLTHMGLGALLASNIAPLPEPLVGEYLTTLTQLHWLSSKLYSSEIGLATFAHNVTVDDATAVVELAKLVLARFFSLTGFTSVEPLLVIDLAQTYLELGEEPSTVIALLYSALSKVIIYALTARAAEWTTFKPLPEPVTHMDRELALVTGIVFVATGIMLVGIAVKRTFVNSA